MFPRVTEAVLEKQSLVRMQTQGSYPAQRVYKEGEDPSCSRCCQCSSDQRVQMWMAANANTQVTPENHTLLTESHLLCDVAVFVYSQDI